MAICKTCGAKYSKWITPVSAHGICGDCFEAEFSKDREAEQQKEDVPPTPLVQETPVRKPIVPVRWSSFLPRSRSKVVFALVMGCYSFTLAQFVSLWAYVAHVRSTPRPFYLRGGTHFISLLIIAPLIESLVLVGVFELLRRARAPTVAQVFVAALFISALHVAPWWLHAIVVLPSFCIQAASYLYWRERGPWKDAFWVLVSIHAIHNFIPALYDLRHAIRHA